MFLYQRMDGNEKSVTIRLFFSTLLDSIFIYSFDLFFFSLSLAASTSGFCVLYRVKCAPIHARMALGVPSALNAVPVTTMHVVITLTALATACPATVAIKLVYYYLIIHSLSFFKCH
jgi:hypothetical protein